MFIQIEFVNYRLTLQKVRVVHIKYSIHEIASTVGYIFLITVRIDSVLVAKVYLTLALHMYARKLV